MLQAGKSSGEIFAALRLQSYYDKDYLTVLRPLGATRLRWDLGTCLQAETALKSRSWLSAPQEIERLVVDICAKGKA